MQSLGADEAVNYREQDIADVFKDPSQHFDVIVDLVGGHAHIPRYLYYCILYPYSTFLSQHPWRTFGSPILNMTGTFSPRFCHQ